MEKEKASLLIKEEAYRLGFSGCGIAQVEFARSEALFFDKWIANGCHAGMEYMENYRDVRLNPAKLLKGAKSILSLALNYYPQEKQPLDAPQIAYYAYGEDYHTVVKDKLRKLESYIQALFPEQEARVFTDSAPILERYWAWKGGLGWIGKNSCLIMPTQGSFVFLGEIVTTVDLVYDTPQKERCGTCTRCLEACPSAALERPKGLNATKCISYLTIENREEIPAVYANRLGNRLFGCDTCQQVCPWNRLAKPSDEEAFRAKPSLLSLRKETLQNLTREDYNRIFAKSAVKRAKYEGLLRTIKQYIKD